MRLAFDIFPAATPLSGRLVRLTNVNLQKGSGFRVELFGAGSGRLILNQYQPEATAANLAQDNFVQVYDLDISDAIPLGGFFLAKGDFHLLDVQGQGAQTLTFGGPGALSYFGRATLWNTNYVHFGDDAHYGPRADGLWHFYNDKHGAILERMWLEARDPDRPQQPIPDMTADFNATHDSAIVSWTPFSGAYTLPIGMNYLEIVQKLIEAGLTISADGNLLLQAYQGFFGTDRTSTIFASGKVKFVNRDGAAGANIVEGLTRAFEPSLQLSSVLVKGDSTLPADMVVRTAGGYNVVREGFVEYDGSHAVEILDGVGDKALALRTDNSDAPSFRHIPGLDPTAGLYSPFPPSTLTETLLKFYDANDGGDAIHWTGILGNQSGGAEGSAYYYFKSSAPNRGQDSWAAAPGDYHITGYTGLAAGKTLAIAWRNDAPGTTGTLPGGNIIREDVIVTGPTSNWTAFDVTLTAPAGTTSASLCKGGSTTSISFDRIRIFSVATPPAGFYWVGDLVTLDTGTEVGDYTNATIRIYAIEWVMDDQGNWWPQPEGGGVKQGTGIMLTPGLAPTFGFRSGGGLGGGSPAVSDSSAPLRKELTNKSGGAVTNGDVVVIDPSNDEAFTTTTLAGDTRQLGIAQGDIAIDAKGPVALAGYVELVNVSASVTRGQYGSTSGTVKTATGYTNRGPGAFCEFLKSGTAPSAVLFASPDPPISWKRPVRAATTANGTMASAFENGDTIDAVVLATGDRILLKDQTAAPSGSTNGIYIVQASGAPLRAEDMKASAEVLGAAVFVTEGTANGNKAFFMTTDGPITLGTTALVWAALSGGGGGGHAITEDGGAAAPTEANLDFRHGLDVSDDAGSTSTRVAVDESELDHALIGGTDPAIAKTIVDAKGDLVGASADNTPARVVAGTEGQLPVARAAAASGVTFEDVNVGVHVTIDGGGAVVTTGVKGTIRLPWACTLVSWTLEADVSGSCVLDIWDAAYALDTPPVVGNTIIGGGGTKPTLASHQSNTDSTLTGYTVSFAAGRVLRFNVDSATTVKRIDLDLRFKRA